MRISTADKVRIALTPLHVVIGGVLLVDWVNGPRTPMVLVLGVLFVAYGGYKLRLVARSLRDRER